jgi:hypothetical protein
VAREVRVAVPWLRSLVAGLSPGRPGIAPGSIHVGFVVDKVALGQVFLRVVRFSLSIYHSTVALQTHINWGMRNMLTEVQYTDQEMIPARNARSVVTLAEVMFVTIQRENILPSKITDY